MFLKGLVSDISIFPSASFVDRGKTIMDTFEAIGVFSEVFTVISVISQTNTGTTEHSW